MLSSAYFLKIFAVNMDSLFLTLLVHQRTQRRPLQHKSSGADKLLNFLLKDPLNIQLQRYSLIQSAEFTSLSFRVHT